MAMTTQYAESALTRADVDQTRGPLLVEFGASWCGICRAAQPALAQAMAAHPALTHLKIEDGPGKALGRSFRVKLWPTLVLLADGQEVARLVRPTEAGAIAAMLAQAAPAL